MQAAAKVLPTHGIPAAQGMKAGKAVAEELPADQEEGDDSKLAPAISEFVTHITQVLTASPSSVHGE
jgi:hypothetical protein